MKLVRQLPRSSTVATPHVPVAWLEYLGLEKQLLQKLTHTPRRITERTTFPLVLLDVKNTCVKPVSRPLLRAQEVLILSIIMMITESQAHLFPAEILQRPLEYQYLRAPVISPCGTLVTHEVAAISALIPYEIAGTR